jgi:glycosyltransferase involved in cell wall biosynthesis
MVAVIWIDWYAYHLARLRALTEHRVLSGKVFGIELVGGCGVHGNLRFRHSERGALPISTLLPESDWGSSGQLRISAAVWRKLNELNPAVVLVPGYYNLPALTAAVWAQFHRRRAILMSETTRHDHRRVWWKELVKRTLVRTLFDSAIAGGSAHVRYLQELGFEADLIGRSYDVVDNSFYQEATALARAERSPADAGLPSDYFLYVGRLAPEKNLRGLLESFHQYRRSGGQWSLVLVGEGPSRQELMTYVRENALESYVHFAGLKNSVELVDYYAFANCFVLPSSREPWGLVVNEAMAAGLPVIVSNRCGCAEDLVEPGENGAIIDPAVSSDLTAALLKMESLGAEDRERMGRRSLERIRNYSPETWAAEVVRLVEM